MEKFLKKEILRSYLTIHVWLLLVEWNPKQPFTEQEEFENGLFSIKFANKFVDWRLEILSA